MARSRFDPQQRLANLPQPTYPDELPVVARRADIARAIDANQVVIICGETGSGKTTQLPKICLELKRGVNGLIGHTQPRRIAARTVAARVAQELDSPLGDAVGYKVRFTDGYASDTYVKLMTDGILLAETQGDRLLRAYDTLIIDEAHERSLNIDFLLGYLKRMLPQRPDLQGDRHLGDDRCRALREAFRQWRQPAPVIEVSGRMYPVEVRYRPLKSNDEDEEDAGHGGRDRRRGRRARAHRRAATCSCSCRASARSARRRRLLRKHHPKGAEILPLYARLSADEQDRVFKPHGARRIVLATNVAETSLTVPGIRYVIDTGLARVNRYSYRNKVEQLQVEQISRASANQRAGRCGRVAARRCVRLYAEEDYARGPSSPIPEMLRTSLAAVILRMKSLSLGEVERVSVPRSADRARDRRWLSAARGARRGRRGERADRTSAGSSRKLPIDPRIGAHDLGRARAELPARDADHRRGALGAGSARAPDRARTSEADEAHEQLPDERSDFLALPQAVGVLRRGAQAQEVEPQAVDELPRAFPVASCGCASGATSTAQLHALVARAGTGTPNENARDATSRSTARCWRACSAISGLKSRGRADAISARAASSSAIFPGSALRKKPAAVGDGGRDRRDHAALCAHAWRSIEPEWLEQRRRASASSGTTPIRTGKRTARMVTALRAR